MNKDSPIAELKNSIWCHQSLMNNPGEPNTSLTPTPRLDHDDFINPAGDILTVIYAARQLGFIIPESEENRLIKIATTDLGAFGICDLPMTADKVRDLHDKFKAKLRKKLKKDIKKLLNTGKPTATEEAAE